MTGCEPDLKLVMAYEFFAFYQQQVTRHELLLFCVFSRLFAAMKFNDHKKAQNSQKKIQGTSRLSKQVVEIIVRPNPEPMDPFTIPAADCAIFC